MSNVNLQVKKVCTQIQNDTALKNGYHAIGFSQGAQFLSVLKFDQEFEVNNF